MKREEDGLARGRLIAFPVAKARDGTAVRPKKQAGRIAMRLLVSAALMLLAATLHASAQSAVPPDVLKDLAPTGKLRAAINFGNGVLAQKGKTGEPQGVTADLSRELAKRLGVEVSFI